MRKKFFNLTVLFALISVAVLFCSCQKEGYSPVPSVNKEVGQPILFGVAGFSAHAYTKALTPNALSSLDGGFMVTAVAPDKSSFFDKQIAVKKSAIDGSHNLFEVKNYYWPTTGTMSFYGVFPKSGYDLVNTSGAVSFPVGTSTAQFDGKSDVIAAKAVNVANRTEKVSLDFGHVLHWVNGIKFTNNDENATFKVKSISLDAPGYGTFNFVSDSLGNWSGLPAKASYKKYDLFSGEQAIAHGNAVAISDLKDVMVIAAGACTLNVTYSVTVNGATDTYSKSAGINLWQGKKSTISAELTNDLTPILFSVSVKDWKAEDINAVLE